MKHLSLFFICWSQQFECIVSFSNLFISRRPSLQCTREQCTNIFLNIIRYFYIIFLGNFYLNVILFGTLIKARHPLSFLPHAIFAVVLKLALFQRHFGLLQKGFYHIFAPYIFLTILSQ